MNHYIQTYGKQLIKELMDIMCINKNITSDTARDLLIKYNIISKRTKIVNTYFCIDDVYGRVDGRWDKTGEKQYKLNIKNGRGTSVLYFIFKDSEIPSLLEEIENETDRSDE